MTTWNEDRALADEARVATLARAELIGRAEALGVFDRPADHTDQELRDAIAAEEAADTWLKRLEQLPDDEAKRDAVHRLRVDLETAALQEAMNDRAPGRPQTTRGRRILFEGVSAPREAPEPQLCEFVQPARELPVGDVLAYLSSCSMCSQQALTRTQWGHRTQLWVCPTCNGGDELTITVRSWLPGDDEPQAGITCRHGVTGVYCPQCDLCLCVRCDRQPNQREDGATDGT